MAYLDIRQTPIATVADLLIEKLEDRSTLFESDIEENTSAAHAAPETRSRSATGGVATLESVPVGESPPATPPASRNRRSLIIIGVALLAAVGVALGVTYGISATSTTTTPPTTAAAPTTTASTVSDAVLQDDFSGPSLDAGKWKPPSRDDVIKQADGHLLLTTRPGRGVDYTKLQPFDLPRPFTDIRFTVTVPPYAQGGQGGGSLVLNPTGKQPQLLALGPGSDGGVVITPLPCDKPSCRLAVYEDFTEPTYKNPAPVTAGEKVPVELVEKDGRLLYFAKGIQIGASTIDPGPLTSFWFAATAGPDESWTSRSTISSCVSERPIPSPRDRLEHLAGPATTECNALTVRRSTLKAVFSGP